MATKTKKPARLPKGERKHIRRMKQEARKNNLPISPPVKNLPAK